MKISQIIILFIFSHQIIIDYKFDENFLLNKSINEIENIEFDKALKISKNIQDTSLSKNLSLLIEIIQFSGQKKNADYFLKKIDTSGTSKINPILISLIKGYSDFFYNSKKPQSFQCFFDAYILSKNSFKNNKELIRLSLRGILKVYEEGVLQNNTNYLPYLNEFRELSITEDQKIIYLLTKIKLSGVVQLHGEDKSMFKLESYIDSLNSIKTDNPIFELKVKYANANFLLSKQKLDEAKSIYTNIISKPLPKLYVKSYYFNSYIKISYINYLQKKITESFAYLKKAKKFKNKINSLKSDFVIKLYESEYYSKLKKFDSAFFSLKEVNQIQYKLNFLKSNEIITQSEIQNKTKEIEKKFLIEKQEKILNRYFLIISLVFLFLGIIIAYLRIKNTKKRQELAEKQQELEIQKNLTLLKEQEITTINAMVDGQEKERKRIAEDLHDNLGSVLATLKLHFENLKINREKKKINQKILFDRTEDLINEAYLKVRSIAHAKNAGVIANQGLLLAIQMMAEKISSADKINIEVVDFGLDKRLENSLEITIFRIIQELITNILKHAEAQNATINISLYDHTLNIIIEDDGKGFSIDNIDLEEGMGLNSIKTRIKHLNGTFEVDSMINKGTSILINIPIT